MRRVIDVFVPGIPVTKGSVNVGRQGQVRQAARGYAAWSDAVRRACDLVENRKMAVQRDEGAMIRCRFWVPVDSNADVYGGIWAPGARDGDKLDRAVWDAVTRAGLWQDDAQVVEWAGSRRWADTERVPGVHIGVWALSPDDMAWDGAPVVDSRKAYRRAMYGAEATG